MDGIMFSLVAVPEEIAGGKKVYRAYVKTNGTIDKEALAKALAEKTGQDISLANYFLEALNEILAKEIVAGYRVNLGQLSTGFSIKGSFQSEDDRFDPKRHSVQPTIQALDPLKSALAAVGADNITVGLTCRLGSLMDFVTKALNEITGTDYTEADFILSKERELCENCGKMVRVAVRRRHRFPAALLHNCRNNRNIFTFIAFYK